MLDTGITSQRCTQQQRSLNQALSVQRATAHVAVQQQHGLDQELPARPTLVHAALACNSKPKQTGIVHAQRMPTAAYHHNLCNSPGHAHDKTTD